jgi:hypothetical protein
MSDVLSNQGNIVKKYFFAKTESTDKVKSTSNWLNAIKILFVYLALLSLSLAAYS